MEVEGLGEEEEDKGGKELRVSIHSLNKYDLLCNFCMADACLGILDTAMSKPSKNSYLDVLGSIGAGGEGRYIKNQTNHQDNWGL